MKTMTFKEIYENVKSTFLAQNVSNIDTNFSAVVHITGKDEGYIYIAFVDGQKIIEPVKHNSANIVVSLSSETFEQLVKKQIDPFKAFTTGKIKAKGNVFLALSLYKKYKNS